MLSFDSCIQKSADLKTQPSTVEQNKCVYPGQHLEGIMGEKEIRGKNGKKRREKGRKEGNRGKTERNFPYFVPLFNKGSYDRKFFFKNSRLGEGFCLVAIICTPG